MRFFLPAIFLLVLTSACDHARVYEYSQDFKDRNWRVNDTARFEFKINDPGRKYNLYYNVRNSLDYPYARLFVQYALHDSTGTAFQKKMVSQFLFDQKTGKPQGTSGLGDIYDHQFPILTGYEFAHAGKYRLSLEQFMRLDTLPGILSVGVRVEFADVKK